MTQDDQVGAVRFLSFNYRQCHVISHLDEITSQALVDAVLDEQLVRERVFRDNWRTLSARIRFQGESLLLKIPRARNSRRWERFLTRFRESDALRTFRHLERMPAMGFAAPEPVLACERRQGGMVTDSFVCYRFVEGRPAGPEDAPKILVALNKLHQLGYVRSDAQLANFLVTGDVVTFIDFRLKKPWFLPKLHKAREVDRFLRSCPEASKFLSREQRSSGWLWLATRLESISFGIRNLKRKRRDRRKTRQQAAQK